ncbi:MAG TPA: NUDIX domain-containing protein [Bryobacteraceae bacterium]|nr:NUDIX domain-containing protein [Bryobacteraceae bacterium]
MSKRSAGVLLFRQNGHVPEILLVHPGGPFWARKDAGAWSIPKGEYLEGEDPLVAARREFAEETGIALDGRFLDLGEIKQAGGKIVRAWALEGELDPALIRSNTFELEWPPKSGVTRSFPEIDAGHWFTLAEAERKMHKGQLEFLPRLLSAIGRRT